MKEEGRSSAWERYVEAKRHAFEEQEGEKPEGGEMTLEQLEAAIAETAASSGIPETGMPPRSTVHPPTQSQLSRWFYRVLVILFCALVGYLFWWGNKIT